MKTEHVSTSVSNSVPNLEHNLSYFNTFHMTYCRMHPEGKMEKPFLVAFGLEHESSILTNMNFTLQNYSLRTLV